MKTNKNAYGFNFAMPEAFFLYQQSCVKKISRESLRQLKKTFFSINSSLLLKLLKGEKIKHFLMLKNDIDIQIATLNTIMVLKSDQNQLLQNTFRFNYIPLQIRCVDIQIQSRKTVEKKMLKNSSKVRIFHLPLLHTTTFLFNFFQSSH